MKISVMRYFYLYIVIVIIGLMLTSGINYYVDPADLFSNGQYEREIANLLLSGKNVAVLWNFDEGYMQKCYISNLNEKKDIIVLGSSRSMQIRSTNFVKNSFLNLSTSGANIENYLDTYSLYVQHHEPPSVVILGLDPWILKKVKNGGSALEDKYVAMLEKRDISLTYQNSPSYRELIRLKELISFAYLKESVWMVLSGRIERFYSTEDSDCKAGGILADGSRVYNSNIRNETADELEALAVMHAKSHQAEDLKDFTEPDKERLDIFIKFIEYLQQNQVRVIFFLPPYHPTTYNILTKSGDYKIIVKVEEYFRNIAQDHGITVIGSYNPENIQGHKEDFYDGLHPKEILVEKLFLPLGL